MSIKTILTKNLPLLVTCMLLFSFATVILLSIRQTEFTAEVIAPKNGNAASAEEAITSLKKELEANGSPARIFSTGFFQKTPVEATFSLAYRDLGVGFTTQNLTVTTAQNNTYSVTADVYGIEKKLTAKSGQEFKIGSLALIITSKDNDRNAPIATSYQIELISAEETIRQLTEEEKLETASTNGNRIIRVTDTDPKRAEAIASLITKTDSDSPAQENTIENIANQITAINEQLALHEQKIAEYKRSHQLTDIEKDIESSNEYLNQLKNKKSELELQMVSLGNLHTYIRNNIEGSYTGVEYDVITDPTFNESIARINDRYIQKSAAGLQQASSDAELQSMKEALSERILNTRRKIAVKIDQISGQLDIHQSRLSQFPLVAAGLQQLEREKAADQRAFDLLTEKYAQAITSTTETSFQATPVIMPVKTQAIPLWLGALAGALAGLVIGSFISVIKTKKSETYIHDRKAFEKEGNKIRFLGSLNHMSPGNPANDQSFSELCTRFLLQPSAKMITVASAGKGEGKSFVAAHFARYMAALDKKVLLIDMNMYAPVLARQFGVGSELTLNDALEGQCDIHECINITNFPNLEILTAGELSKGMNTLLLSRQTSAVFDKLRNHYDLIIIDTPEAATYIDAVPMMKMSDMTFFVVRASKSSKTVLEEAELITTDFGINNLFLVLNDTKRGVNHSGSKKGKVLTLVADEKTGQISSPVHNVFRKIALWFY